MRTHLNYKTYLTFLKIKLLQIDYADFSNGNLIDSAIQGDKIRKYRSIQKIAVM